MTPEQAMAILDAAADEYGFAHIKGVGQRTLGTDATEPFDINNAFYYLANRVEGSKDTIVELDDGRRAYNIEKDYVYDKNFVHADVWVDKRKADYVKERIKAVEKYEQWVAAGQPEPFSPAYDVIYWG